MDLQNIIIWLIVGAIAGWLAGMVVKGGGFGLIGDIVVGIVGAVIAGWPALVACGCFELLIRQRKASRPRTAEQHAIFDRTARRVYRLG